VPLSNDKNVYISINSAYLSLYQKLGGQKIMRAKPTLALEETACPNLSSILGGAVAFLQMTLLDYVTLVMSPDRAVRKTTAALNIRHN